MSITPDPDEFTLEIDGKEFRYFSDPVLTRAVDQIDTFSFSAPFEPSNREFRDTFRPASYREVQVKVGGRKLFTGTMFVQPPSVDADAKTIECTAYAKCGVLEDCPPSIDAYPLQFDGLKLDKIATVLLEPFGLTPSFGEDPGPVFEKTKLEPGQRILDFLADRAKERGLIITSDEDGNPLFWKSANSGSPVAILDGSKQPVLSVSAAQFDERQLFSEFTGIAKAKRGRAGSKYTEGNPFVLAFRPAVFELDETEPADVPAAVQAKIGRMWGNAAQYDVEVATLRDSNGFLWERNTFLRLKAVNAMIYREIDFLIRSVTLAPTTDAKTATLRVCLPGAFSGELPEFRPWDE